jgi:uncharacterized protein
MKIALIGATGYVGGFILKEALSRGHEITAIARHREKLPEDKKVKGLIADILIEKDISKHLSGNDAVISAYNPGWKNPYIFEESIKGTKVIINSTKEAGVKRLLIVGGAGSLEIRPGVQLVDTPDFPKEFKDGALGAREALNMLKSENVLDWTFISPSMMLEPGTRTGKYRIGTDALLVNDKGESRISTQDLAAAILDEIENPKFIKKRFTVGY